MSAYDRFAEDYHWLLDDDQMSGRPFVASYEHCLAELPPGAQVLDAACGIGVEALELARRSLRVYGTDASAAMVTQARQRATAQGLDVEFAVSDWSQLPSKFSQRFALVVCNGNSLVHAHAPGASGVESALSGMAGVADDAGKVVIGTRDFEHLRSRRPDVEVAGRSVTRNGTHCVRFYTWRIPSSWSDPHTASVHLALINEDRIEHRRHDVEFTPYTSTEFQQAITAAGLTVESSTRTHDSPRYTLVLRMSR
ncbi:MAG: class I SAM-dependent methyltransferase [Acidimicrobiales bacterium]